MMTAQRAGPIKTIATWAPLYDGEQWQNQWTMLQSPEVSEEDRLEMMKINGQVPGVKFFNELFAMRMEDHLNELDKTPMLHIHGDQDFVVTTQHDDR